MKKYFKISLVIIWMAIIFCFSHQASSQSSDLSLGLTQKIINFIMKIFPNLDFDFEIFHLFIRKNAHFFAYLVLGFLVNNAMFALEKWNSSRIIILLSILICVLYAISDEIHQVFIPGRVGSIKDVLIDSIGALFGALIYYFLIRRRSYENNKNENK